MTGTKNDKIISFKNSKEFAGILQIFAGKHTDANQHWY